MTYRIIFRALAGRAGIGWIALAFVAGQIATGMQAAAGAERPLEYNRDVRPILVDKCFACHGPDTASREADLRLDVRDSAVAGDAIVPGDPTRSKLVARILTDDPDTVMPPPDSNQRLSDSERKMLVRWIEQGASYQPHWSFMVPRKPPLPPVRDETWARNEIDRFVLASLEADELEPAAEADPRALFRRLSLDTTGLPPAAEDVRDFVSDFSRGRDAALSTWIDRLMNTPAWGEHRARYWLDAARYADTHGLHFDNYREMWPYRDWVIRSFNANQPFDRFTIEQIAGDLLPDPTRDQLIATGFQRCNITTNEGGTIDEENLALYAADRVQTLGWVYLGLTTNCAQCHDHKFDALTMKDYYALAAFFRNTTQLAKDGNLKDGRGPVIAVPVGPDRIRWNAVERELAAARRARDVRKLAARDAFDSWLAELDRETLQEQLPREGLTLHVPLDEGQGSEVRASGPHATTVRGTGEIAWSPQGKIGPAPVISSGKTFDAGDAGDFERDQEFSYGAWVKPGRSTAAGAVVARMDQQQSHRGWDLWKNDQTFAVHLIHAWPENAIKVSVEEDVATAEQWQHLFVTYDGSGKPGGIKIYVDGSERKLKVEQDTLQPGATIRAKTPLRIGQRSHSQEFDQGGVQDVRIYDRALRAAEVRTIAAIGPLHSMLEIASDERTAEQQASFLDYYLETRDRDYAALSQRIVDLEGEQEAIRARSPVTHIQRERMETMPAAFILKRGEYDKPGDQVAAETPASLHPLPESAARNRLGLAQWLVAPTNPLTARVTVNRYWQEVFGRGLVTTPEDFGVTGSPPSHPELLDWLAVDFQENEWDVKRLFKLILMSSTYRQSARTTPRKLERDRDNRLLSRGPRYRMDAEMIRDHALAVSGLLSTTMYGPGTRPYQPEGIWEIVGLPGGNTREYVQDQGENLYRRTIYTFWKRMAPPPSLEALNATSREVCTVRRERTNTPLQALVTLNDPQFVEAARSLAERALLAGEGDEVKTLDRIAQRLLGRSLVSREEEITLAVQSQLMAHYRSHADHARALVAVGQSEFAAELDVTDLAAWTMLCNQLMNLDEVLTK